MELTAGESEVTISFLSGYGMRVDFVRFDYTGSVVETGTWARLKMIYRG